MSKVKQFKKELSNAVLKKSDDEPRVTIDNYKIDLIKALNHYNTIWVEADYRKSAEVYVSKTFGKELVQSIRDANFTQIKSIGSIGRLIMRDQYISPETLKLITERIENLNNNLTEIQSNLLPKEIAKTYSVQDKIQESVNKYASDIDDVIDQFILNDTCFSMKSFLASNQISGVVAKKIGELYKPSLKEVENAINGKDEQLVEGYGNFSKRKLKQFYEFLQSIIADCNQQVMTAKTLRKPRKRKVKPASVIVNKMSYMREFAPLNLKSISPEEILKASELWVYNTDTRKLIVYYAENGTLGVSGKSITNYDVNKSEVKTIRKPEEFFKKLTSTGKRAMTNVWNSIKAKASKARSRISDDMILLAAN